MNKMKKKFKLPIKMRPQKQNSKIYQKIYKTNKIYSWNMKSF